jgi:HSP20 family protein
LAFDVHESDSAYTVVADLPGLTADQINVKLDDDVLTVSAEVQENRNSDNARALLQERVYGKFSRSVRLPQPVARDQVEATYENGVLTLTLPKAPEAQPRLIAVKPGKVLQSKN